MVAGTVTAQLDIEIWSDVMCPWCVVGYKNLEKALAELEGEVEASVRWAPFELNPDMPPEGEDRAAHIARKYGRTAEQSAKVLEHLGDQAERAGFSLSWQGEGDAPPAMMWNTRAAHVLLGWALEERGPEVQTQLKLALFEAHFQRRRNVSDRTVLLDIAEDAGLDRAGAAAGLEDDNRADDVLREQARAYEMNLTGVPAMIVNRKLMIPGAQSPDVYAGILRRVAERLVES